MHSSLLLPLVAICSETIYVCNNATCLVYVCCSDSCCLPSKIDSVGSVGMFVVYWPLLNIVLL